MKGESGIVVFILALSTVVVFAVGLGFGVTFKYPVGRIQDIDQKKNKLLIKCEDGTVEKFELPSCRAGK